MFVCAAGCLPWPLLVALLLPDLSLRSPLLSLHLQLAEQRREAQEEAESRELAHLAELEAAQDGVVEVGAPLTRLPVGHQQCRIFAVQQPVFDGSAVSCTTRL